MSENKDTLCAFILGGLIGAALGVLYAPKSGKETRQDIKRFSEDVADKVKDLGEDFTEKGRKVYEEGKDKINEVLEAGKKAFGENNIKK
ncbi:MAG: YtxH domain-containing protein [Clostridiales Family XIII bacterium]|nr:YtxH domain-containing protein [Clostridiales Family XIII bacterium]